ncbi:hypothetical protein FO519_007122 [Halicephalobus sp. NKZ332]|nr:hypothetical protein FO519_007122 [Halicephalobus sp. NKZ332]
MNSSNSEKAQTNENPVFVYLLHMILTMVFGICGNLFLTFVIWRGSKVTKHRISPVQLLLLHTCVADILFAIFSLGTEVAIIASLPNFHGNDLVCKLTRYLQAFPMYASAFLLVVISADRYQAICRPLAHYRTDRYRRPNCLATTAWLLAFACSTPQLFIWKKSLKGSCTTVFSISGHEHWLKIYVIYFGVVAWLIPSVLAGVFYYFVCTTVWKSKVTVARLPSYLNEKCDRRVSEPTREYVNGLREKSLGLRNQTSEFDRKRIQTVRLTLTIIVCNFLLWAPFCCMNVFYAFIPSLGRTYGYIINYILILGNLNSCVNPWIYILFNSRITKRALTSIVYGSENISPQTSRITYGKRSSEPVVNDTKTTLTPKTTRLSMTTTDTCSVVAI